jgi:capsular polysaccharide biosynthesis protein
MAAFFNLFNEIFKVLSNYTKLKDYFVNYKKNKTYIFNSIFRVISRSMPADDLYKTLHFFSFFKFLSIHYTVFLMLSAQINSRDSEVLDFLNFIKKRKKHIPLEYVDLHYFELLHENIKLAYTKDDFLIVFQTKTAFQNYKMIRFFLDIYPPESQQDLNTVSLRTNKYCKFYQIENIENTNGEFLLSSTTGSHHFVDPLCYQDKDPRLNRSVKLPNKGIWKLENVIVNSEFQILKDEIYILHDKSSDPRNGFVAGHWQTTDYVKNTGYAMMYEDNIQSKNIDTAALISGRCTKNYFHWLIEYAPKIIRLAESEIKIDYILIGSDMPRQHYEFLDFLCRKYNFKYMEIGPRTNIKINTLYVPSQMTYIPDDPKYEYWESGGLYEPDLQRIADLASEMKNTAGLKHSEENFDKVYITRKNVRSRSITNEDAVEQLLKSYGFKIVDTSHLNLVEQIQVFQSAKVIASPAGAAMANLVFCKPNTQVICLVADINKKFCLQANIASLRKCNFTYLTGALTYPKSNFVDSAEYRFSDFTIPLNKLEALLKDLDDNSLNIQ